VGYGLKFQCSCLRCTSAPRAQLTVTALSTNFPTWQCHCPLSPVFVLYYVCRTADHVKLRRFAWRCITQTLLWYRCRTLEVVQRELASASLDSLVDYQSFCLCWHITLTVEVKPMFFLNIRWSSVEHAENSLLLFRHYFYRKMKLNSCVFKISQLYTKIFHFRMVKGYKKIHMHNFEHVEKNTSPKIPNRKIAHSETQLRTADIAAFSMLCER